MPESIAKLGRKRLGTTVLQRERDRLRTIDLMRQVCRSVAELRIKAANIVGQQVLDDLQLKAVAALASNERDGADERDAVTD